MRATITIKLAAETKDEAINTFGGNCQRFREMIEQSVATSGFAGLPPDNVELRWLVVGGRWVPATPHMFAHPEFFPDAIPDLPEREPAPFDKPAPEGDTDGNG